MISPGTRCFVPRLNQFGRIAEVIRITGGHMYHVMLETTDETRQTRLLGGNELRPAVAPVTRGLRLVVDNTRAGA